MIGLMAGFFGEVGYVDYVVVKLVFVYGLLLSLKNEIVWVVLFGCVNVVCFGWMELLMMCMMLMDFDFVVCVMWMMLFWKVVLI